MNQILPVLCRSGSGALAWYQIRNTPLANTAAGAELHEVYRRFRLSALIHEREIAYVFSLLRTAGIEAVLVKGWAIARRYPDRALRPYGDIDICVSPDQFEQAQRVLRCLEDVEGHFVDLHRGFGSIGKVQSPKFKVQSPGRTPTVREGSWSLDTSSTLPNRPTPAGLPGRGPQGRGSAWDRLWTLDLGHWTKSVSCAGEPVRILSDEDHLRLLSIHLLRSGAWRPVWLCDIALLAESVQSPSQVQSPKSKVQSPALHANWVQTTMALAQQLLGADISDVRSQKSKVQSPLPGWLVPAVQKQWGRSRVQSPGRTPTVKEGSSTLDTGIRDNGTLPNSRGSAWHRLWTLDVGHWANLYRRWDNPIRATAAVGGEFNNWPRLPYRVLESIMRLRELPYAVGSQWAAVGSGQWAVGSSGQWAVGSGQS